MRSIVLLKHSDQLILFDHAIAILVELSEGFLKFSAIGITYQLGSYVRHDNCLQSVLKLQLV